MKKSIGRRAGALLPLVLLLGAISAQQSTPPSTSAASAAGPVRSDEEKRTYRRAMEEADQKIADEVKAHTELVKNLEYLTTQIGARLTGSAQMQKASDWTLQRFKDYGIDAHLETTEIPHSYQRGIDTASITAPYARQIGIHALGWSKPTAGEISGTVVVFDSSDADAAAKVKGHMKGAIVLAGKPAAIPPDNDNPENAYDAVIPPQHGVPKISAAGGAARFRAFRDLAQEGMGVVLLDSGKTDNLFNMGSFSRYQASDVPLAFLTHEDYDLIYRLSQSGPVSMKVNLTGLVGGPAPASITVAEIKGSEHPEERVIIGGHLDSWDLGQGALDNGTGAMAVLEAARTLKTLGWKPKRTITFILFTGEEQGGVGADTFLKNHAAEIPKIDAVLVHDTGTGKVFSIALEDYYETASLMDEIYHPISEVYDMLPLSTRNFGSSDHVPFQRKGVAAYFCVQKPAHYREAHHSQTDTFDKVIPEEINQGAAVLASWAWNVSEMPQPIPHHAPPPERQAGQ
jgi:hypothetical protein